MAKKKLKSRTYQKHIAGKIPKWIVWVVIIIVVLVGVLMVYNSFASDSESPSSYRFKSFSTQRRIVTWKQTVMYNLDTGQEIGGVSPGTQYTITGLANYGNAVFYVIKEPTSTGQRKGIYINTAYAINNLGQPIFNGHAVAQRNLMPLTNQRTAGGECTASRIWYEGLNNNLVAAVQRVQLQIGNEVPFQNTYRTNSEQSCLYARYAGTSQPVAPPGGSNHNRGLAIDVNRDWLNSNSSYRQVFQQYYLCEAVANDPGHFELCN